MLYRNSRHSGVSVYDSWVSDDVISDPEGSLLRSVTLTPEGVYKSELATSSTPWEAFEKV